MGIDSELRFNKAAFSCQILAIFPYVQLLFLKHAHALATFEGSIGGFQTVISRYQVRKFQPWRGWALTGAAAGRAAMAQ